MIPFHKVRINHICKLKYIHIYIYMCNKLSRVEQPACIMRVTYQSLKKLT